MNGWADKLQGLVNEQGRLVEGAFAENEQLEEVILPEGITDIGEVAFFGCRRLHRVVFPSTLRYIREEAFGESGIEELLLPASAELIAEKACFDCPSLRRISVPNAGCRIERDAFGCCPALTEGYAAPGYPAVCYGPEELQYTLLWCSCPQRHTEQTSARARAFIRENEALVMEHILRFHNIPAMSGIARLHLLEQEHIEGYVAAANREHQTELAMLLLAAKEETETERQEITEEFAL